MVDDDATERDHSYLGGAAADVHDHRAYRLLNREAGAYGRGHGLLDGVSFPGPGVDGGVVRGAALHLGDSRGDADHHAGLGGHDALRVYFMDEVLEHRLDHIKVGDDAVFEGANGDDVAGSLADHSFGLGPYGVGAASVSFIDGDY